MDVDKNEDMRKMAEEIVDGVFKEIGVNSGMESIRKVYGLFTMIEVEACKRMEKLKREVEKCQRTK